MDNYHELRDEQEHLKKGDMPCEMCRKWIDCKEYDENEGICDSCAEEIIKALEGEE
jgi:hypothetical protein